MNGNEIPRRPIVLVVGASGFVGSALMPALRLQGYAVRLTARQAPDADVDWAPTGDLCSFSDWDRLLKNVDHVIHLASFAHDRKVDAETAERYRQVNVGVTKRLLAAAERAKVDRFIYISSTKVYGEQSGMSPLHVDSPLVPDGMYGQTKLQAEHAVAESDMRWTILRPCLVGGPGVKGNLALLQKLLRWGLPFPAPSDNRRSVINLFNLVQVIMRCLEHPAAIRQKLLLSDPLPFSTYGMVQAMAKAAGLPCRAVPVSSATLGRLARLLRRPGVASKVAGSLEFDGSASYRLLDMQPQHQSFDLQPVWELWSWAAKSSAESDSAAL